MKKAKLKQLKSDGKPIGNARNGAAMVRMHKADGESKVGREFAPGHPKLGGKVLGSKNTMTITNEVIEAVAKKSNITPEEAELVLWKKAYNEALNGDFQYHKDWMDRRHGKATEKVEVSGAGEIVHYHIPVRQEPGKWSGDRIQGKS